MSKGNISGLFTVRSPAWHDPEGKFDRDRYPKNVAEARKWSGQEWEPVTEPVYRKVLVAGEEIYEPINRSRELRRSDTLAHLAVTRDKWEPVGIGEMYSILEAVQGETRNAVFETAGVLDEGREVWALVRLDEPFTIPGDTSPTFPFLAFLNRYDGMSASKITPTNIRIVCYNTYAMADAQGKATGNEVILYHSPKVHDRVEEAKRALAGLRKDTAAYVDLAEHMAKIKITPTQRELFITEFIPAPHRTVISPRVMANIERDRTWLRELLADESPTTQGINGTAYGLVQAAGEFLDHLRGHKTEATLLRRALLRPEPLKANAVKLAKKVATID